jgi:peroxiredoxin
MADEGDEAPDFTVPLARDEVEPFTLSARLDEAPIVLAFFPGAFTSVCTGEMRTLRDRLDAFSEVGATVYGISVDSPFSLQEFREQEDLNFGLLSDSNRDVVEAYDVSTDFEALAYENVAERAVFVIDEDREVAFRWVGEDVTKEPDYGELEEPAAEAAA